ncbi:MAG: non-canonical purine NTP pyrophosphatase, partial [Gemmataceae bacterium]|nr:non-canonical purine NTP pyrophosphatase [Gemmataceae bacterium]
DAIVVPISGGGLASGVAVAAKALSGGRIRVIAAEPRGSGGFGYDPLFVVPEFGQTFGELPAEVKQRMSHRANAFRDLRPVVERELANP